MERAVDDVGELAAGQLGDQGEQGKPGITAPPCDAARASSDDNRRARAGRAARTGARTHQTRDESRPLVPARRDRPAARRDPRGRRILARRRAHRLEGLRGDARVREARRPGRLREPGRAADPARADPFGRRRGRRSGSARSSSTQAGRASPASTGSGATCRSSRPRCGRGSTSSASIRAASDSSAPVVCLTPGRARPRDGARDDAADARRARGRGRGREALRPRAAARQSGALLPYLTTEATARDLDRLREALGDPKLTYVGFSYGTVLGATYASLFPHRVRALALDGAADPVVWTDEATGFLNAQAVGAQHEYAAFLAWCRGQSLAVHVRRAGRPGRRDRQAARPAAREPRLRRDRQRPEAADRAPGGHRDRRGALLEPLLAAARRGRRRPLRRRRKAAAGALRRLHRPQAERQLQQPARRVRRDQLRRPRPGVADPATYFDLTARFARISPVLGGLLGYEQLPCAFWPVKAASRYTGPFNAPGAPPILVVGTTGDPATPYVWAKALARELDSGVLVTRVGRRPHGLRRQRVRARPRRPLPARARAAAQRHRLPGPITRTAGLLAEA